MTSGTVACGYVGTRIPPISPFKPPINDADSLCGTVNSVPVRLNEIQP